MKKALKYIVIAVLIAAAIFGYNQYKKSKNKPEWRMDTISVGNIREEVTSSGTLNPLLSVNVGTEVSGKILKLYKDYNSPVKKGEILAELDKELLQSALESSQTDVKRAQSNVDSAKLDRDLQKQLFDNGMGTEYDMQKAKNSYDQAVQSLASTRYAVQRAEKNLQNAIIISPINGVIVSRNVDEGQTVAASLNAPTLFVIANNLQQMQITAAVDEADIGKIKIGLPVEFTVDAFADEQFEGKVNQIRLSPTTDQNVVTYSVIIDVSNPELKLLPGMTANVTIIVQEKDNVLRIPESALRFKPSKEVWKMFGLKWDEAMFGKKVFTRGNGGMAGGGKATAGAKTTDKTAVQSTQAKPEAAPAVQNKGKNMPAMSDSQKAAFAKMTPDQKKALREKMGAQGGRPDFSKMTDEQKAAYRQKMAQNGGNATAGNGGTSGFFGGKATREKQRQARVLVLKDNKPVYIDVVTGLSDGNYSQVISGLTEGQEIIIGVNYKTAKQINAAAATPFGGMQGRR